MFAYLLLTYSYFRQKQIMQVINNRLLSAFLLEQVRRRSP